MNIKQVAAVWTACRLSNIQRERRKKRPQSKYQYLSLCLSGLFVMRKRRVKGLVLVLSLSLCNIVFFGPSLFSGHHDGEEHVKEEVSPLEGSQGTARALHTTTTIATFSKEAKRSKRKRIVKSERVGLVLDLKKLRNAFSEKSEFSIPAITLPSSSSANVSRISAPKPSPTSRPKILASKRILILSSNPRSGSSLLADLISSLPKSVYFFEPLRFQSVYSRILKKGNRKMRKRFELAGPIPPEVR